MFVRVLASLSLSVAFLASGAVVSTVPAHADAVSAAQARVHRARAAAVDATRELSAGTREWEADRRTLDRLQRKLAAAAALVKAEEAEVAAGRARVAVVARRMYMSPGMDLLGVAIGMNADEVLSMMRTRGQLRQIAGSDTEIVRRAHIAQLRLEAKRRDVAVTTHEAQLVAARAARHLRDLQALANRTARELNLAEGELGRAQARRAARLSALRAARYRALLSRSGGAGCQRRSTDGMSNGNLDPAVLCHLWQAPGHRLRTDAARAFNRMSQYHMKVQHRPLCVTDSYRSYAAQVDVYRRKPELAAVPGTSEHGWGRALDLCGGVQTFGTAAFRWMKRFGPKFGWHHPAWAEPSGSKPEAWHWEYGG